MPFPPSRIVRVLLARLDDPPLPLATLQTWLAPDELARAARFVFERDRRRYAIARGLLRRVLGAACDMEPQAITLAYGPNGRPELRDASLAFNVSHSGDRVAIAFAAGDAGERAPLLGVDLEEARPLPDLESVAARVFDEAEMAVLLARAPGTARLMTFHRLWTRKEACMKATGAGFALAPIGFHVDADAAVQSVALPPHELAPAGASVAVLDVDAGADHAAAVAIGDDGWTMEVAELH